MDEFSRIAWERKQQELMINVYPREPRKDYKEKLREPQPDVTEQTRWSLGNILGGLLMVSLGGFLIWGTFSDLAEHFKPAQPVPVQEESPPDVTEQIRKLERMIAEAKQLNVEINAVHDSIKQTLAA